MPRLRRYAFLAFVMLAFALPLAACGKKDKNLNEGLPPGQESGPLADIYGGTGIGSSAPGSREDFIAQAGDRVFFDTDRYDLTPEARSVLEAQAAWLQTYPQISAIIEGHADERGTREYNLALGERRAQATRDYLVTLGIDASRLSTVSYGKERPEATGSTPEAWALNRRGVTQIQ